MVGDNIERAAPSYDGVNRHIQEYLTFFLDREKEPNFAVLITGPWGIGKTFLVKRYLGRYCERTGKKYLYVSLYGLGSIDEINTAVVEAMYPLAANKGVKIVGKLLNSGLKKFIDPPELKYTDFVDKLGDRIIVFDDLERCEMSASAVLGYVNQFVEHDTCSVVVLANEAEIDNGAEYFRVKEKVVGKTLAISPSLDEALDYFVDRIANAELKTFLKENIQDLAAVYNASETHNLRILFQVIADFERLWDAVLPDFRSSREAMRHVLQLVSALSFELRSGGIVDADLADRHSNWISASFGRSEDPPSKWAVACRKYASVDLSSPVLSDEVLHDILVRGEVKAGEINACLALSSFFVGDMEPAWRTLWYAFSRSDEQTAKAHTEFSKDFADRAFRDPGVVLHAFGLKLWLADMQLDATDRAEAKRQCETYLEDLVKQGKIEPLAPGVVYMTDTGYGGLGFHEVDSAEFKELHQTYLDLRRKSYEASLPRVAETLLLEMVEDPDLFGRRITITGGSDQRYAHIPIFAALDPDRFAERLLELHPGAQQTVAGALLSRYAHGELTDRLASEKPWLDQLKSSLRAKAASLPIFGRNRVERLVRWYLEDGIEKRNQQTG